MPWIKPKNHFTPLSLLVNRYLSAAPLLKCRCAMSFFSVAFGRKYSAVCRFSAAICRLSEAISRFSAAICRLSTAFRNLSDSSVMKSLVLLGGGAVSELPGPNWQLDRLLLRSSSSTIFSDKRPTASHLTAACESQLSFVFRKPRLSTNGRSSLLTTGWKRRWLFSDVSWPLPDDELPPAVDRQLAALVCSCRGRDKTSAAAAAVAGDSEQLLFLLARKLTFIHTIT
jgi:hypothetical protein